jgi:membrane fusion protein, multidrug efflux system
MTFTKMKFSSFISALFFLVACSAPAVTDLESKKTLLKEKEKALSDLRAEILAIQTEIDDLDTSARDNSIAVFAEAIKKGEFKNPFQLQGLVESDLNVLITPEVPGRISSIRVKEGQYVTVGQVLVTLDASVAYAQIAELKSALTLAETNYNKQSALWKQNIGSEMQYLQAKNQFDNLTSSLSTANQQLAKYTLRSPISGTVDELMANRGEFVGSLTGGAIARIVNLSNIKVKASASEKYVGQIKKGQSVEVYFPSLDLTISEKIEAVGNVIDIDNRTFSVYIRPHQSKSLLKPNLLALITAYDYVENDVISVPTKLVRNDGNEDFILTIEINGSKKTVKRTTIEIEKEFASLTIVKSGLNVGDLIITEGFNAVIEGDHVKIIEHN